MTSADDHKTHIIEEATSSSKAPRLRRLLVALLVLTALALIATGWLAWRVYNPVQEQAQAGTDLAAQVKAACADPEQNTADLRELCDDADDVVASAPPTVGEKGDPGVPGEPGPPPSDAQVANAVALYCSVRDSCSGPRGDNASPAQVAEAVASYCDSRGQCRGPAGADGTDGDDGATGPPPSDDQVASAVSAYCSTRNGCAGPQGPKGDTGPEGPPGPPGVVDVQSDCDAPDGQVIDQVNATYNPDSKTITISCTYKDDQGLPVGGGPGA